MNLSPLENAVIQSLATGATLAEQYTEATTQHTDALADRVQVWLGIAMTKAKETRPRGVEGVFTVGLVIPDAPDAPLDPMRNPLKVARGSGKVTSWGIHLPSIHAAFDTMGP